MTDWINCIDETPKETPKEIPAEYIICIVDNKTGKKEVRSCNWIHHEGTYRWSITPGSGTIACWQPLPEPPSGNIPVEPKQPDDISLAMQKYFRK